jgi:hypothetical protein
MSDGYESDPSAFTEEPHQYARGRHSHSNMNENAYSVSDPRQGGRRHAQGYDAQSYYAHYSSSRSAD